MGNSRFTPSRIMMGAGLLTWAAVGSPVLIAVAKQPAALRDAVILGWAGCWLAFGAALLGLVSTRGGGRLSTTRSRACALALPVLGLAANWLLPAVMEGVAIGGALMVIAAASLVPSWSVRTATIITAVQSTGLALVYADAWPLGIALVAAGAFAGFQFFALLTASIAESERRARSELAAALNELRATQSLLEQSVRQGERVRIAREIHDVMGHHLAALSLNLEAAWARTDPGSKARDLVASCRTLAWLMLSDVRAVVSDLKEEAAGSLDVAGAIRQLGERLPDIEIEVEASPPGLRCEDPARALALLRVAQEFISNTLRHSASKRVRFALTHDGDRLSLEAADDGPPRAVAPGPERGLAGLRSRLRELGGDLSTSQASSSAGFALRAWLPLAAGGRP